ncbi:MAG: amidohydrolase family protein [Allosphingosinicella sp.]
MIIDAHAHFYDPSGPRVLAWPRKKDGEIYRRALPKDYRARDAAKLGSGVIAIETSSSIEDNQWVLDLAATDSLIVGFVGNLPLGTADFRRLLARFAADPLLCGIRVNHRRLKAGLCSAAWISDLELLARSDLGLDVYGGPELLGDVARLAEILPQLHIVVDHLANVEIDGRDAAEAWRDGMRAAASHDRVFCKISALVEGSSRRNARSPAGGDYYRPVLDVAWEAFGENRLMFGSNWPVSERHAPLAVVQGIVADFVAEKGSSATEKVFHANPARIYRLPTSLDHRI